MIANQALALWIMPIAALCSHFFQLEPRFPRLCCVAEHARPAAQVKTIAAEIGVGFLTLGFDPKTRLEDVPIMPKERYRQAASPQQNLRALGRRFCHLAEHFPLCYLSQENRESASFYKLQFCRGLRSM